MLRKCLVALLALFAVSAALADEPRQAVATERGSAAVQLSDAELDQVVGGGLSFLILSNPGNDSAVNFSNNHFRCLNACLGPTETGATGFQIVVTPSGNTVAHCIGGGSACF